MSLCVTDGWTDGRTSHGYVAGLHYYHIYSTRTITSQCHSAPQITVISLELWRFINYITYLLIISIFVIYLPLAPLPSVLPVKWKFLSLRPPPVGAGGGYMFSGRPSVPLSVRASVRDSCGSFMFPRYLQYLLTDFRQTFVTGASRDRDELIRFGVKRSKFKVTPSRWRHTALDTTVECNFF